MEERGVTHLAMTEEKYAEHQARVHGSEKPAGAITLTLPYPISANRYWFTMVDPALITALFKALMAAVRGNLGPAQAILAEHSAAIPRGRAMTFPSTEAKAYKKLVAQLALEQGVRRPLAGPVEVTYQLYPHLPQDWAKRAKKDPVWWDLTVQCMDLDNCRKVVNDALKNIVFGDDSLIRNDHGVIMIPDGEARLVLAIKPYERAHPQEGLFESEPVYVPKRVHVEAGLPERPF